MCDSLLTRCHFCDRLEEKRIGYISTEQFITVTNSCVTRCSPDRLDEKRMGISRQNNSSQSQTAVWLVAHQICHFYKRIGYIKTEQFISHKQLCGSLLARYVTSVIGWKKRIWEVEWSRNWTKFLVMCKALFRPHVSVKEGNLENSRVSREGTLISASKFLKDVNCLVFKVRMQPLLTKCKYEKGCFKYICQNVLPGVENKLQFAGSVTGLESQASFPVEEELSWVDPVQLMER